MDDLQALKELKARYCRTMDAKDWAAMRKVFADEVTVDSVDSGGNIIAGADAFLEFLQDVIGPAVTIHHCHMPEIDITSETTASGVWAMEDILRWPDGSELHGYGHYHETYDKRDGEWRISSTKLTRVRMDFTEGSA